MKKSRNVSRKRKKRRSDRKRRKLLLLKPQRREVKEPHQLKKAKRKSKKLIPTFQTKTIPTAKSSSPM